MYLGHEVSTWGMKYVVGAWSIYLGHEVCSWGMEYLLGA